MGAEGLSCHLDPLDWYSIAVSAPDGEAAWSRLTRAFSNLGADTFGFVYEMPNAFGTFPTEEEMHGHFITNDWHAFYLRNQHLIRHDIMARHLFTSRRPAFADMDRLETFPIPAATPSERTFVNLIKEFGLKESVAMSFFDRITGRVSIFMINALNRKGSLEQLGERHREEFHRACHFFLEGLVVRDLGSEGAPGKLSAREVDCLQWAAVGRSTKEIADLLGLNDNTVNEYFASAKRKLRAASRTQAVARAIALSLISP